MKPNYQIDITHEGTLGSNRQRMGIDEASLPHLLQVLTDLYSDAKLAVVREYSINALDSHRMAGNPDPVEVNLPSELRPFYEVIDHGVGMSLTDLTDNFARYGWSSKRETDEATGYIGIGCKSALTYTSQFTLAASHHGLRTTMLISRDEEGVSYTEVVDTRATEEPNGVLVRIPVPLEDIEEFNERAERFFRFWHPGTVLVDGQAPKPFEGLQLDEDVLITRELNDDYIVMGNVPYPVTDHELTSSYGLGAVVYVPMGSVHITPSRESLAYTDLTKETLDAARIYLFEAVVRRGQSEIDKCIDRSEAVRTAKLWSDTRGSIHWRRNWRTTQPSYTYQGRTIPSELAVQGRLLRSGSSKEMYSVATLDAIDALHVTEFTVKTVTQDIRHRVKQYQDSLGLEGRVVLLYDQPPDTLKLWCEKAPTVTWEELKEATPPPPTQRQARTSRPVTYPVVESLRLVPRPAAELHASKLRIAYVSPSQLNHSRYTASKESARRNLNDLWPGWLLCVSKSSFDKVERDLGAVHVRVILEEEIAKLVALSPLRRALLFDDIITEKLNVKVIEDPELAELLRTRAKYLAKDTQLRDNVHRAIGSLYSSPSMPDLRPEVSPFAALQERYPILFHNSRDQEHLQDYVNGLFRLRQENA